MTRMFPIRLPPFCLKPGLSLAENGARLHGLSLGATRLRACACAESAKLNAAARDAPRPRPPLRQRAAGGREAGRGGAGSAASFSLTQRRPAPPATRSLPARRQRGERRPLSRFLAGTDPEAASRSGRVAARRQGESRARCGRCRNGGSAAAN